MEIIITSILTEKIDVTTLDFPGISEGKRDYINAYFKVNFHWVLPSITLEGECKIRYDEKLTPKSISKMIEDRLKKEVEDDRNNTTPKPS